MAKAVKAPKKAKTLMTDSSKTFLRNYINTHAPVSFESSGQKVWLEYLKPFVDDIMTDPYGTAVGIINPGQSFKVVIEAHADEISWYVNYITPEGLIYVKRNGGSDHQIAPSMRVFIHTKKGIIKGVFGWPAIHTRSGGTTETPPKLENIFIDCGVNSKKQLEELGVKVGNVITFQDGYDELANGYYIGRAFDNRIGGFMIAEVARLLKENKKKLPYSLYVVNAVQEEIGLRGAEMIARRIKPDVAIVTDVTHDTTTPMIDKKVEGDIACGKGPSPTYGPPVHTMLLDIVEKVAEKNNIPLQMRACSRSTGTDTDSFAYANDGCPSVLISIPLRYMHTTVEMLHQDDIDYTIKLMYETLLAITPKTKLSYF